MWCKFLTAFLAYLWLLCCRKRVGSKSYDKNDKMLSRILIPYCNRDSDLEPSYRLDCDSLSHLASCRHFETALHRKIASAPTAAATSTMTIHNGSLPSLANGGDKDSFLLSAAKLLMADEFSELDTISRDEIASVKLYLNNEELLVAAQDTDRSSKKPRLTYLRTHLLSEVTVMQDLDDPSCMRVKESGEQIFLYRLRQGAATIALWMSRINRPNSLTRSRSEEKLTRCNSQGSKVVLPAPLTNGVLPTMNGEDHDDQDLRRNSFVLSRMSAEWHGEQALSSPLLDLEGILLTSEDPHFQPPTVPETTRPLSDAYDMENLLQERRRSLSVPDKDVQTDSASENGSCKPFTSPSSSSVPRKIRFRRFLTSTTPPRRLSFNRKKRSPGEDIGSPPLFTKPKSPGSLLKSFRKRFSSNGLKISPSVETSPTTRHPLSIAVETDGPWVLGKLYRENIEEVAQQLSLIDAELLDMIDRRELEHCAWMKKSKFNTSPNVLQMISAFNKLALLVSTEILSERTPNKRMKAISQYIHIASKCYKLHNYNSLNAILAGLQSASVFRLQKSWRLVTARRMRKYRLLTALMSTDSSWENYKIDLQKQQRRRTHCIPFFGQFLTALSQENSLEDFDTRRPQGAWGNSPVPDVTASSLRQANLSGTSISLPDISVAVCSSKTEYSDESLPLRLLPLTSSQSASDIHKLSESSITDGIQPTVANIHQTSRQDRQSKHQREDSATWESLPNSQTSVAHRKRQSSLSNDQALNDSAIAMDCDPKVSSETTISNDPQSDSPYELSTIELNFDDDHSNIFNGTFLSTDENPSTISLDGIAAEAISSDEESFDEEDSDDEEELVRVFHRSSFGSLSQAGILFGASPPPQKPALIDEDRSLPSSSTPDQDQHTTTSSEPSLPTPDSAVNSDDRRTHNRSYSDGTPLSPRASPLKTMSAVTGDSTRLPAFHLEATTPHLILLEKYKFFSQKYRANFPERPKLRQIVKEANVLTEDELYNLSRKRESI